MDKAVRVAENAHFVESAALLTQCAHVLDEPITMAAEALLAAWMRDAKLLACGSGIGAMLADMLCHHLVVGLEHERMELAAMSLSSHAGLVAHSINPSLGEMMYAKQVHALGRQHDVLCVVCSTGDETDLMAAVQAAHERDMLVLAITGGTGGSLSGLLHDSDLLLNIPHQRALRINEAQMALMHALCAKIDTLLLGESYTA